MKKTSAALTLFNDETFIPAKHNPKEIVEKLINYIYVTLRKRKHSEITIVNFIRDLFPPNLTDIISSIPDSSTEELMSLLYLTKEQLTKEKSELLTNWTESEIQQANALLDDIIRHAQGDDSFFEIARDVVIEALTRISRNQIYPKDSFLIPTNKNMFSIIDLFAGKPNRIPRSVLLKPKAERSSEEEQIVQNFINSIIKERVVGYNEDGSQLTEYIAIISDTPRTLIQTDVGILTNNNDSSGTDIENIAAYISRTFGAEGFRHFLAILSKCSENLNSGTTRWNLNEHLRLLGITKKKNGTYKQEVKEKAIEMLKMFISLHICFLRKDNNTETLNVRQLFTIVGFDITTDLKSHLSKEDIVIRAEESWFLFNKTEKSSKIYYTRLLKKLLTENSQLFPHILTLSTLLAVFWRIELSEKTISMKKLLSWCKIDTTPKNAKECVEMIEKHLNRMVEQGYLGEWSSLTTPGVLPSKTANPIDHLLKLSPPLWLSTEFQSLQLEKHKKVELPSVFRALTKDEFNEVISKSGLKVADFALKIGVSRQTVSYLRSGKKRVSLELSGKIWSTFPDFFKG